MRGLVPRPAWQEFARCRGMPPEMFYLDSDKERVAVDRAKAVCDPCPVKKVCLEAAYRGHEEGIWGGLTESERRAAKRKRRVPKAAATG